MPYIRLIRSCPLICARMTSSIILSPYFFLNCRNPKHFTAKSTPMKSEIYVPPIRRLRSVVASASGSVVSVDYDWRESVRQSSPIETDRFPYYRQQSSHYARYAYEDLSEDESDRDLDTSSSSGKGTSTLDNVDEWKWKFSMLLRNESEQELISRERKDRRDFEHIAVIAERMGLHSRQYAKVVVFSKLPLPNYRPDLDDKRPQREVSIPFGLQREVDSLLTDYLTRKKVNPESFPSIPFSRCSSADSIGTDDGLFEQQDTQTSPSIVMEKMLRRRSLQLRNQQAAWQV